MAMAFHWRNCSLCRGYDGTLAIGILPVALFASGHTYFVQRLHERMGLEVYCVHATFQFSGTDGKRHRMRERMLWVVVSADALMWLHYSASCHCLALALPAGVEAQGCSVLVSGMDPG